MTNLEALNAFGKVVKVGEMTLLLSHNTVSRTICSQNSQILILISQTTWYKARDTCRQLNMTMVEIHSEAEWSDVNKEMLSKYLKFICSNNKSCCLDPIKVISVR